MKTALHLKLIFLILTFVPSSFAQEALSTPSVRLIYFLPKDRPPRPERITALKQVIKDAQEFYANEMERHGYGRKTFNIETDNRGEPVVHHVHGQFNENYYYNRFTGVEVWKEFYEHANDLQHIYFFAIDLSSGSLSGGNVCGTGGVNYFPSSADTASNLGPPVMRYVHETQGEEVLGGAVAIPASGSCFERIGLTLHELGHAFGLQHDFREGINNDYVMAYAYTKKRLSKCAAEWLSVSRFFNSNPEPNSSPGSIQLISKPRYSSDGISIRFKMTDADGLHQAQLLGAEMTEQGTWKDYKLFDCKQLKGKTSTIKFISQTLTIEPVDNLMLQIIDVNGGITWATFLTDIGSIIPRPKTISVPDKNLKKAIQEKLGLNPHANITDRDMKTFRSLKLEDKGITNISGLEHATELEHLLLGRNKISNYAPLAQLSKLKRLFLWANGINDLNVLPPMPQLAFLDLNWNQISDLSPLAEFTSLKELWLQGNKLADTSTLFQLHGGIFPPDEEVEVIEEQDNANRTYMLLVFRSLDLKVRINPDATVYRSLNAVQNARQTVTTTNELVEKPTPATNVLVEDAVHPPMYWISTKNGALYRLVGTEVKNLVPRVQNATSLAIDVAGRKLYWTEKTSDRTGKIRRANLNGTNVQLIKDLTSVPLGIALDTTGGKIYLTNAWGKVQRLNVDGSNFQPNLITNLDTPRNLVLDVTGGKVYWTETTEASGRIRRANLNGSNVQNVVTGLVPPLSLAVANGKIYWTEGTTENTGKLHRANLDGTNSELLETLPLAPTGIAVDPANRLLYLTLHSGEIHRKDPNGSGSQPVVTGLVSPSNIVLGITTTTPGPTDAPEPSTTPTVDAATDVNQDQKVNKTDLLLVVTALGEKPPANPNVDVNADGAVNMADVLLVIEALDDPVAAAAPSFGGTITPLDPAFLTIQIDLLRAESDGSLKYAHAIAFFQGLLASIRPTETQLHANYPNPFNPETWIPYQLSKPAEVVLHIYAVNGRLIRTLTLGHQPVGIYHSKSRAAYWDGKNEVGEQVASGIYFYTLSTEPTRDSVTAGDFSATRKMLIRK